MGSDSVELAEPLIGLAEVYKKLGKYADSQRVLTKALRIIETGFGPDHPKMAAALHSLAHIHRKQHDDREAERLYCRALAIEEKHGNEAEVAENLLYLAIIHAEQAGKSSEGVSSPRREERGSEREEEKRRKEKEKDSKRKEKAVKAKEKTVPRTEENEYDDEGVLRVSSASLFCSSCGICTPVLGTNGAARWWHSVRHASALVALSVK